jgi:peptidoglycan/LPS O-acetylase OafA/YrhL
VRRDIQALRAVAVLAVVVYHLWPGALPGGFVGVDVFFVISGFLITSHLIRTPPGRPAEFARFWAKRVLRLLPPVVVVILATLLGAVLFMSPGQWQRMATEAVTSMFYVENWRLIHDATDYLDAHRAVSPFQHFWSLSVEEQYYLVWPLLVGAVAWLSRAASAVARARLYVVVFGVVVLSSLALSISLTSSAPDEAYFSTFTRMWELGVGSLLAAAMPLLAPAVTGAGRRLVLLWAGVAAIVAAFVLIDGDTPFPGSAALLPTVGAALVILAADPDHRLNPRLVSHSRPVQLVGDTSYAMYLWHWPLIVLAPYALDREPGTVAKVVLLVGSLGIAWLSTRFLENPVRSATFFRQRTGRVLVVGAAGSALVLVASLALQQHVSGRVEHDRDQVRSRLASQDGCFGAPALDPRNDCPADEKLVTSPEFAKADITRGILDCLNWVPFPDPLNSCTEGTKREPRKRIALFGNSHAGHWLEALDKLGKGNRWAIDTFIVGVCKTTIEPHPVDTSVGTSTEECQRIQSEVVDEIAQGPYDAVVLATMDRDPASTPELYRSTLEELTSAGKEVVVIRDTPAPMDQENEPPDCVARNLDDLSQCAGTPDTWIGADPLAAEAEALDSDRIRVIDLNDLLCTDGVCPAVIGGVIVYSDFNHLSTTFSTTLAPYLARTLRAALR